MAYTIEDPALNTIQNLIEFNDAQRPQDNEQTPFPLPVAQTLSSGDIALTRWDAEGNEYVAIIDHINGEFIDTVRSANHG